MVGQPCKRPNNNTDTKYVYIIIAIHTLWTLRRAHAIVAKCKRVHETAQQMSMALQSRAWRVLVGPIIGLSIRAPVPSLFPPRHPNRVGING